MAVHLDVAKIPTSLPLLKYFIRYIIRVSYSLVSLGSPLKSEERWQLRIKTPWLCPFSSPLPLASVSSSHLQSFKDLNTPQRLMDRLAFWSLGTGDEEGLSTNQKLLIRF
jgi:hypothetical protein